jgi:hypothetical protein
LAGRLESAHIEREIAPTCCNKMISADWSIEEVYKRVFDAIQDFIKSSA